MSLKTLKDMFFSSVWLGLVPPGQPFPVGERNKVLAEVREEAKKWLLDLQLSIGDSIGDYTDVENVERAAQIEWIETFFNLEDED